MTDNPADVYKAEEPNKRKTKRKLREVISRWEQRSEGVTITKKKK